MSTQPQLIIELFQTGFNQILAQTPTAIDWDFPIIYEVMLNSDPAATAQIEIGGNVTELIFGEQQQIITGNGNSVVLSVDLGSCKGVKIGSNPNNETECSSTYPFLSIFSEGDDPDMFQFACVPDPTKWTLDVTLDVSNEPEFSPLDVSLFVDGGVYAQIPSGSSSYDPTATTLAFAIGNFQGTESIKILYTLQTSQ